MCGIVGVIGFSDNFDVSEALVSRMCESLTHRGPDDGGSWYAGRERVALGHRRLSIVDLSPAGHNPMPNEDGTIWITYNGEVYNHELLRRELEAKGHRYRSRTDTETILHLYEEEGPRCVERMHGMFAFAIWDSRRRELFLARDRLGIKPLYYAQPPGGFLFSSEIKALLRHPAVHPALEEQAFLDYLTFVCTPAPLTMFVGIRKVAPAERMTVRADGTVVSETYWSPISASAISDAASLSDHEAEERLIALLRESIRKRMMADVPFGVFLSGGIDSSTNVALMSELVDRPVRTFSVGFRDHAAYNEFEHARRIAERYGTDHHEIAIDAGNLEPFLVDLIHHQDEPIADWVCLPLHHVAKLARESGTIVVQVGEGADELLHGYQGYIDTASFVRRWSGPLQLVPRRLAVASSRIVTRVAHRAGRGVTRAHLLSEAAAGRHPFWGGAIAYYGDLKKQVLANGQPWDSYNVVRRLYEEVENELPSADLLQEMTYVELKLRLAELLLMRVDKMTMATSVEARVPFLDHELVEFAFALPERMKVRDGVGKYVLKKAVAGLLPPETINREKQGFGAPVAEWFRGELGVRAQAQIRESTLAECGLLDYQWIDELWAAHRSGRANWSFQLWNLYNVSAWHDYWISGRTLMA